MNSLIPVAVALGSNLGDRASHMQFAADHLRRLFSDLQVSSYYETEPVGVPPGEPRFLNAAAIGFTALDARATLQGLRAIELARGRERSYAGAARTLDLDLVLYGDAVIEEPDLVVPHPRFRERAFVLEPLAEIASSWRDPVSGLSVGELLARLRQAR